VPISNVFAILNLLKIWVLIRFVKSVILLEQQAIKLICRHVHAKVDGFGTLLFNNVVAIQLIVFVQLIRSYTKNFVFNVLFSMLLDQLEYQQITLHVSVRKVSIGIKLNKIVTATLLRLFIVV